MDDTPKAFLEELRTSVLKKRVGQIALAVVLAEAVGVSANCDHCVLSEPLDSSKTSADYRGGHWHGI